MAVESRHLNLFPSQQLIGNREMMNAFEGNLNVYNNTAIGYGMPLLSGTTVDPLLPMYSSALTDSLPSKTAMKSDSGLTYAHALPVSRKRSRESVSPLISSYPNAGQIQNQTNNRGGSMMFLGEDISSQIQQQQLEVDRFIAQHTEKVRLEIEERRKRCSTRILAAVEEGILKRLRAKEEEIEKIGKLNWALQEKVKSLCVENQIWRDLAQTNEATANALRSNLEQVLAAHVQDGQQCRGVELDEAAALMDDAQSCCGSNNYGDVEERRDLVACGGEKLMGVHDKSTIDDYGAAAVNSDNDNNNNNNNKRLCRHCGKEESCVLLLPCRHLCLCTVCGSSVHACPICNSAKNASVRVIMSS